MFFLNENAFLSVLCVFSNVCTQRLCRIKELLQLIGTTTMISRKRHRDSEVKKIGKLYNHIFKMNNWCHIKIANVIIIA